MIPDHVSIDRRSPHFWPDYRKIGVRIDGHIRRADVVEFCVSEGWAMTQVKDKFGRRVIDPATGNTYLLERTEGVIEPYWLVKDKSGPATAVDLSRLQMAEAKRQRKMQKRASLQEGM